MEDESVQDSDTSQQVGQTPDLLDVLPDGAVEDPAGGQDDVLGEGGIKALRAERAARKAAERQLKESQQALLEAQDAQRAVQSELFELRFEQAVDRLPEHHRPLYGRPPADPSGSRIPKAQTPGWTAAGLCLYERGRS